MHEMAHTTYVKSKHIGDALVTIILDGTIRVPAEWVLQAPEEQLRQVVDIDTTGKARFDHLGIHVALHGASILIDAGMDEPDSPWGQRNKEQMGMVRTAGMIASLAQIGVIPEDITHVLFTHSHWDHVLGATIEQADGTFVPRYPRARHLLNRADWAGTGTSLEVGPEEIARMDALQHHGLLELTDGDYEVMPGVTMLHTPGESAGHSIVRVESGGQTFYALADLVHHAMEFEHPHWTRYGSDKEQLQVSRMKRLPEIAASQAAVIFAHASFPGWGRVTQTEDGYRWNPMDDDEGTAERKG